MFANDPYSFKQLDPQTYWISRVVPSDLPDDHKQYLYKGIRQEMGYHLMDIFEHSKLPATVDIQETIYSNDRSSIYYYTGHNEDVENSMMGHYPSLVEVVTIKVSLVPVKHMQNWVPSYHRDVVYKAPNTFWNRIKNIFEDIFK